MVYIYFPVAYYHLNLGVTKSKFVGGGVFRCPSGLSCCWRLCYVWGYLKTANGMEWSFVWFGWESAYLVWAGWPETVSAARDVPNVIRRSGDKLQVSQQLL